MYALWPFIGSFTKDYPLLKSVSRTVANHTGRTANPLNEYSDADLLSTRLISSFHDLTNLSDADLERQDPLVRQAIGKIPSASTLCRQEMAIGSICESERDRKLNGRKIEDLPKYDPDAIGSEFFSKCNALLLRDTMRRILIYEKFRNL